MAYHGIGLEQSFCSPSDHTHHGQEHLAESFLALLDRCKFHLLRFIGHLHLCTMQTTQSAVGPVRQGQMLEARIAIWFLFVDCE